MIAAITLEQNGFAAAADSALSTAGDLFVEYSLYLSIALLAAAILATVFTKQNPWTKSLVVWLLLAATAAVFAVYWFLGR